MDNIEALTRFRNQAYVPTNSLALEYVFKLIVEIVALVLTAK